MSCPSAGSTSPRTNCSVPGSGANQQSCIAAGCCYDNTVKGVPWCFVNPNIPNPKSCPAAGNKDARTSCAGKDGKTDKTSCNEAGCCYDSTVTGVPWCFNPPETPACTAVTTSKRISCPVPNATKTSCEAAGCCYDSTVKGVPWCFYSSNQVACSSRTECNKNYGCIGDGKGGTRDCWNYSCVKASL